MPRYFFHLDLNNQMPDEIGTELPSDDAAWAQAVEACGAIIADLDGNLAPGRHWRMDVTDADGDPVFSLMFSAEWHRRRETQPGVH